MDVVLWRLVLQGAKKFRLTDGQRVGIWSMLRMLVTLTKRGGERRPLLWRSEVTAGVLIRGRSEPTGPAFGETCSVPSRVWCFPLLLGVKPGQPGTREPHRPSVTQSGLSAHHNGSVYVGKKARSVNTSCRCQLLKGLVGRSSSPAPELYLYTNP